MIGVYMLLAALFIKYILVCLSLLSLVVYESGNEGYDFFTINPSLNKNLV